MHKAKAVVIACIDFRFQKALHTWLKENDYLGNTDEIIVAGASRDIASPVDETHKNYLSRQLDISVRLHEPEEIILCDHQDCGGYKDLIPDGLSYKEEVSKHSSYMNMVENELKIIYPNKKI
jgi:carbonic anhydrase